MAVTRQVLHASHTTHAGVQMRNGPLLPQEESILPAVSSQGTWSDPSSEPLHVGITGCGRPPKPLAGFPGQCSLSSAQSSGLSRSEEGAWQPTSSAPGSRGWLWGQCSFWC